jgi:predicted ATPase
MYNTMDIFLSEIYINNTSLCISMAEKEQREERKNIYVITGGASCGKSTLIKLMKERGNRVLEEVARSVLDERAQYEATKDEWHYRQIEIHRRQLAQENQLNGHTAFADRSLVDGVAYCKHLIGYIPQENKDPELRGRYKAVFVLERLPLKKDGTRFEKDDKEAELIHNRIINEYRDLGYSPIVVPAFPGELKESVSARADFISQRLGALK